MTRKPVRKSRRSAPPQDAPAHGSRIARRNVAKILAAAETVFAETGLHGATVDEIARRAGISKSNLHYYFRTKRDLYIAVLQNTLEVWTASLAKLDPKGDPRTELTAYISEKLDMAMRHPTASRVFANEILHGAPLIKDYLKTNLRALVREKGRVLERWIDEGRLRPIEPVHLIFLIWAATQHYADFLPQVRAVLGVRAISAAQFQQIRTSLCDVILNGALARGE